MTHIHRRACHLCEAICGLEIESEGEQILSIKGDKDDPLSRGYICPKAVALQDIHTDPDRLREPHIKTEQGWRAVSWAEAIDHVAERLTRVQAQHGDDSVAVYAGNPAIHSVGTWLYSGMTTRVLNTRNRFSATSVDQLPHHVVGRLMYGHWLRIPIVDLDRSQWLLMLGANPLASNGSVMTAPNMPGRLKALQARGGKLIVVDPRRTETAKLADQYLPMPPGKDIYFLLAMLHHLFDRQLVNLGHLQPYVAGIDTLADALAPFTPALAEQHTGITARTIENLAEQLAREPKAAVYGRMGVSTQAHGSLCQWAIQLLNIVTGHLDVEGGLLLTRPAIDPAAPGSNPQELGKRHSRVRGLPAFAGEFPAATLADEILTPGAGQVRAMVTIAGNPVLSTPNGGQLDQALAQLDFMVAVDFYLNETTRHADVILPPASPLERDHYDLIFLALAVRNTARYSEALFAKPETARHDWEIFAELGNALRARKGQAVKPVVPPAQMLDHMLQAGAYGLSLAQLRDQPSGVDLGPLAPRMAELFSAEQPIELAPEPFLQAVRELPNPATPDSALQLIGRRHMRSNNSWMHNYHRLVKGKPRDQLFMHPVDMAARGIVDGAQVAIASRIGKVQAKVQACEDLMPGVVSLPHGFGHHRAGIGTQVASRHAGVSANDLTDHMALDSVSGNAAVNGVPVTVSAIAESKVEPVTA
ncbi:molybdopterin-dependent oxidoreductase [Simiduia aestuariiviva]|uniref:Anaerobic selenocysteine-containing dehydrogenase n=1 Tax=Simiduia aestuariiviva TaxID=1510459 RepID=A0A839UUQ7_9GAMM|nr:molybdopterin-dependent oxidoreductase [Simiduia aestuariiviva]MBB3169746.1 anaerobic selenocysteine-containing dehydrogenase [Simiduia aestuariiviva]